MSGRLHITEQGERVIVVAFLQGRSVSEIATFNCCSSRAVESVVRAQFQHLLASAATRLQSTEPVTELPTEVVHG